MISKERPSVIFHLKLDPVRDVADSDRLAHWMACVICVYSLWCDLGYGLGSAPRGGVARPSIGLSVDRVDDHKKATGVRGANRLLCLDSDHKTVRAHRSPVFEPS